MSLKKILSVGTLFALFLTGYSTVWAKTIDYSASEASFDDVAPGSTNFEAIEYLKSEGVVQGYAGNNYKPTNQITRAEFLKIVMEAQDIKPEGSGCFGDVKDWSEGYVCAGSKAGIITGYDDKKFRPTQTINFAEASKIIANTLGLKVEAVADSKNWYEQYVNALASESAIPEDVAGFDYKITRGDMAEMIWRIKRNPYDVESLSYRDISKRVEVAATGGKLQTFDSCEELKGYVDEINESKSARYEVMYDKAIEDVPTDSAESTKNGAGDEGTGYSETNVQVAGVDEADIVKTDGQYIYTVRNDGTLRIVKAVPATEMKEIDLISFEDGNFNPVDMYVGGDRLVVLGNAYGSILGEYGDVDPAYDEIGFEPYSNRSVIYVYDISDKSNIELDRKLSFEGDYTSSRKIGDMVYTVINKPEYYYYEPLVDGPVVPLYYDSELSAVKEIAPCDQVRYFPAIDTTNYLVVAGVNVKDKNAEVTKEVVLGSSGNIYASKENLYIADPGQSWDFWIMRDGSRSDEEKTYIHKFSLGSDIEYKGKGEVPGHILNQFSMDENEGYFRIATTRGHSWDFDNSSNSNLYILDKDMKQVGSVEGIAPGEEIYSVRFMGDRAYMVTFKKVDPLFVIDVSSPSAPKILGKLKIPGYSDYLHPLDENHILGFGKDAVDASEEDVEGRNLDFAWYQGMKIAMFDVTNVEHPVELHKEIIGDRGTDSPLLWNHKALMFDKAKGIMIFPVTLAELSDEAKKSGEANAYGDYVYQGAYVYKVSVDGGFKLMGRITHYDEDAALKSGFYWYGTDDIDRALYIGNYLYTVSQSGVKVNTYDADLKEVGEVMFE